MGQSEIINFLIKHPNVQFDVKALCEKLSVNRASITRCVKRLREENNKNIEVKVGKRSHYTYKYIK